MDLLYLRISSGDESLAEEDNAMKYNYQETSINDILIVGNSEASFNFSESLQRINTFTRIIHVIKASDAVKLLVQDDFSIIIIDNEAVEDPISLSKLIRINLPLARIIVIATDYSVQLIRNLVNNGSIDAFIPTPIDPFSGSSVIIEQYAKYQINCNLFNLITVDPPKFSQSYYLLHDPSLQNELSEEVNFVGFVILYSSLTKYIKFYNDWITIDEYLMTGYMSAISLLGEQLFENNSYFKEINFGPMTLLMQRKGELQYLFFFSDLPSHTYQQMETEMNRIVKRLTNNYQTELETERPTSDKVDDDISNIMEGFYVKQQEIIDHSRRQNLILFGNQLPKLNFVLSKKEDKYNVFRYFKEEDLIFHLMNDSVDIVLINQILEEKSWNFIVANQIKEINPSLQTIAMIPEIKSENLLKILNNENIDYVISYKDNWEEIEEVLDTAFTESLNIRKNLLNYHPQNLQYSLHRSVVARSMLRTFNSTFEMANIPEFYGVFIMQADVPYYRKTWDFEDGKQLQFEEHLFAGFVSSMEMFTNEIFSTQDEFSGFTFGDLTIVIKHQFDFIFLYFLENIDHTNSLMIDNQFNKYTEILFESILNSEGFFNFDIDEQFDITQIIDQLITELFIKLVSLNFS